MTWLSIRFPPPLFALGCLTLAALWDRYGGEPRPALHPVVWLGSLIGALTRSARPWPRHHLWLGGLMALAVPALACEVGYLVTTLPAAVQLLPHVFLLKSTFSLWTLLRAADDMKALLFAADLVEARKQLAWLCSRDASALSPPELAAASIESVAENLSDSLVAPLFYYVCFGLAGALAYRAINTADAMIGYRGPYEYLGKAAARLDDVANYVPARLTALLLLLAGAVLDRTAICRGATCWAQEAGQTASPNAGVPMATMAGLLARRLDKPGHYRLGAGFAPAQPADIAAATALSRRAGLWAFCTCALSLLTRWG